MIYLDANFFIFALFDQTKKGLKARSIQKEIILGKIEAITSVLVIDEIMWVIRRNGKDELLRKVIEDIYAIPNLDIREVSSIVPLYAVNFIEKYKLKPRDAFHVAIMEALQIDKIVSDDSDFDKIDGIERIKLE